jgi:hypothetical protein
VRLKSRLEENMLSLSQAIGWPPRRKGRVGWTLAQCDLLWFCRNSSPLFVAKGKASQGPATMAGQTGPLARDRGSWSLGEAQQEKTGVPSAKENIPSDQGSCWGIYVHVSATNVYK